MNLFVEQWCKYTQNFKKYSNIILIFNKFQMDGASLIINVFKAQFLLFLMSFKFSKQKNLILLNNNKVNIFLIKFH